MKDEDPRNHPVLDELFDGVYFTDRDRRITYWNRGAEVISGFSAAEVVGRRCMDGILAHVDAHGSELCHGPCPLAMTMADSRTRECQIYLHHKEGHRVPVNVRTLPIRDPGGAVIGGAEVFEDAAREHRMRREIAELRRAAELDALTEIPNRRYLDLQVRAKLREQREFASPFGVLLCDVDRFKAFNDSHGHAAGDAVLRTVARTLAGGVRALDVAGRWGGEEFLVVAANATAEALEALGERLRALVGTSVVTAGDRTLSVTISLGGAAATAGDTPEALLARADAALYRAKEAGRNRMQLAP